MTIHLGGPTGAELLNSNTFNGVETRIFDVPALDTGQYSFVCSIHPTTMIGTLTAQ